MLSKMPNSLEVGQSENELLTEEECMTKTGFALTIGDEELVPFGEFDIDIDGEDFTFLAVSRHSVL